MQLLHDGDLEELFQLLRSRAPGLVPTCLWLVLGPKITDIVLEGQAQKPTRVRLIQLVKKVRRHSQRLLPVTYQLLARSKLRDQALVHIQLDDLLKNDTWQHPTQVLDRPRMTYQKLLKGARARLKTASPDQKTALETVMEKLERAARIDAEARRRRLGIAERDEK